MAHIYSQFLYLYLTYSGHWVAFSLTVSDVLLVFVFLTFINIMAVMSLFSEGTCWVINDLSPHMFWQISFVSSMLTLSEPLKLEKLKEACRKI